MHHSDFFGSTLQEKAKSTPTQDSSHLHNTISCESKGAKTPESQSGPGSEDEQASSPSKNTRNSKGPCPSQITPKKRAAPQAPPPARGGPPPPGNVAPPPAKDRRGNQAGGTDSESSSGESESAEHPEGPASVSAVKKTGKSAKEIPQAARNVKQSAKEIPQAARKVKH